MIIISTSVDTQTPPPPEKFDVKAILNGGIPISEVEDEYIQETLNGMDVSCVFIKRDNEYYDFKPEISPKNRLKTILKPKSNPSSISLKDGGTNIKYL